MESERGLTARSWGTVLTELSGIMVFFLKILILLLLRAVYFMAVVDVTVFNSVSDQLVL
jgi:hypothetical protein